jgi:hypothetical protein
MRASGHRSTDVSPVGQVKALLGAFEVCPG